MKLQPRILSNILKWILLLSLLPVSVFAADDSFTFMVVGDCHPANDLVFQDAKSRHPKISFIASTGDNAPTGDYLKVKGFDTRIGTAFPPRFPWFLALGNHNADDPADMAHMLENFWPRFSTQLKGVKNFRGNELTNDKIALRAFDLFKFGQIDIKGKVIDRLMSANMGRLAPESSEPSAVAYFVWNFPDISLAEFSKRLQAIDLSSCLGKHPRLDTEEEIRSTLEMIFMINKFSPYSFDYKNAHFIFLNLYYDSQHRYGHIYERQMEWLIRDLENNEQPMTFVFGHEPGFPFGARHWGDSLDQEPEMRDRFFKLLAENRGIAYFSGHTHIYGRSYKDGVYDVGVGAVSGGQPGRRAYMAVEVQDNKVIFNTYAYYHVRGEKKYSLIDTWTADAGGPKKYRWKPMAPGPGGWVTALAIDPNDSRRVLAGGDVLGVSVSMDGGLTWEAADNLMTSEIEDFLFLPHPYEGSMYYAFAATMGGVYESYNGGKSWLEKTVEGKWYTKNPLDDWPTPSAEIVSRPASAFALATQLYVGTGSMRNPDRNELKFGAIYKMNPFSDTQSWNFAADLKFYTRDGEANIQHLIAQKRSYYRKGIFVEKPDRLFAALRNNGVWASIDGGQNWARTKLPVKSAFTMAAHQADENNRRRGDTLYVATGETGIYKTIDAGLTWKRLDVDAPTQTIDISSSNQNILYAGVYQGANRGVIKTMDAGETWRKVFDGYNQPLLPYSQGSANIKHHALAVDPNDPDHVIVGDDVNLYVTFDGGVSWKSSGGSTSDGGKTWTSSGFSGLCAEFIAFDPQEPNHFILGAADGALWQTWNNGETFERPVADALGPSSDPDEVFSDFQDGAVSHGNGNTIFLVVDLKSDSINNAGPLFKTADAGKTWAMINQGPFTAVRVKMDDENEIIAIGEGKIRRSIDGGRSFSDATKNISAKKITLDPNNMDVFYATSGEGVYRSEDGGQSWKNIGGPKTWSRFGKAAADPTDSAIIYATSQDGFWKYDGKNWRKSKSVELASDITVSWDGTVYGTATAFPTHDKDPITTGVWRSDDKGETWLLYSEGIRVKRISAIEAGLGNGTGATGPVIAGSDGGGFYFLNDFPTEDISEAHTSRGKNSDE